METVLHTEAQARLASQQHFFSSPPEARYFKNPFSSCPDSCVGVTWAKKKRVERAREPWMYFPIIMPKKKNEQQEAENAREYTKHHNAAAFYNTYLA